MTAPAHLLPCLGFLESLGTELLLAALVLVTAIGIVLLWLQGRRTEERLGSLGRLAQLERLVELQEAEAKARVERGEIDGRRLEHVLVEVRDGIKRLDQTLMTFVENQAGHVEALLAAGTTTAGAEPSNPGRNRQPALAERVVNRLLALGFEGIQIVPDRAELERIFEEDGDLLVEVRRDGALYKGRVEIRDGVIQDVQLRPFYSLFP
ncbi:MAG: hypothetical protein P1V81_10900 [Planctomycetota bacterium]|nr:hypothetical protein [Planctomycetota bacterium]